MLDDKLFHTVGPATQNARFVDLILPTSRATSNSHIYAYLKRHLVTFRVWKEWLIENNTFAAMEMTDGDSCGSSYRSTKVGKT